MGEDQRLSLQVLESLREDVWRDPPDPLGELVEAPGPVEQGLDDEKRPAVSDSRQRLAERRGFRFVCHAPIVASHSGVDVANLPFA